MQDLIFQNDGSIILVAEQIKRVSQGSYMSIYYNYLLITKISPNGELAWMKKLSKKQIGAIVQTKFVGIVSYEYIKFNNYHYLMFFDKTTSFEASEASQLGFLSAYKVDDKTGEVINVPILDNRAVKINSDDKVGIRVHKMDPSKMIKLNEKEYILEVYLGDKKDMLIKLKLD